MMSISLTQTCEYALRAMSLLAPLEPHESLSSAELSQGTDIPIAYLSKILRKLVKAKLLKSQTGAGGGFKLFRKATEISFGEILRATGYNQRPERCAFGAMKCDLKAPCPLHDSWSEINESFKKWANNTTLADVKKSYRRPKKRRTS